MGVSLFTEDVFIGAGAPATIAFNRVALASSRWKRNRKERRKGRPPRRRFTSPNQELPESIALFSNGCRSAYLLLYVEAPAPIPTALEMKTNYAPEHAPTSFSTALTRPYASTQISRTPIDRVVAEIIAADDHAENEPKYKLLQWVAEVIVNDELTT